MIKQILISGTDKRIINSFNSLGINTFQTIENKWLDKPVACHADCAALKIDNIVFAERGNAELLESAGFRTITVDEVFSPYPNDVRLNAKVFGKDILCNTKHIDNQVKAYAEQNGFSFVHCNQGYAACSTFKIDDKTAVTDDETIYKALKDRGIDCLYVSRGSVRLDGYDCGFIGGCCGMIDSKTAVFAGNPLHHSDGRLLLDFLKYRDIKSVSLFDGELIDFGGFINLE